MYLTFRRINRATAAVIRKNFSNQESSPKTPFAKNHTFGPLCSAKLLKKKLTLVPNPANWRGQFINKNYLLFELCIANFYLHTEVQLVTYSPIIFLFIYFKKWANYSNFNFIVQTKIIFFSVFTIFLSFA